MLFALWFILFATFSGWAQAAPSIATTATDTAAPKLSLEPVPSLTETLVYSFKPTHEQIWHSRSTKALDTQYADWKGKHVTIYQPTDCDDGSNATWQIESLNMHGNIVTTSRFTRIPIVLPAYIDQFTLNIQCHQQTKVQVWRRSTSLPIPTLYWKQSERGTIETILHNGQTLSLHVSVQTHHEDDWKEIIVLHSSHPFEVWTLPNLTAKGLRMEVKDGTNTLIDEITYPINTILAPRTTFPLQQTIHFNLPRSEMGAIYSNTETFEPLYFYHQQLTYTPSIIGLHWLTIRSAYKDLLAPFWVYDGAWKWFASPVWETSISNDPFAVLNKFEEDNTLPFLRWNDSLLLEHRSSKEQTIQSVSSWVHGKPNQKGGIAIQISPEDHLQYRIDTHSLMTSQIDAVIDTNQTRTHSQWLFRSDVQASDERLASLLPFIFTPITPVTAAQILHHAALFWTPLHTRDLDWFTQVRHTANQALRLLEETPDNDWHALSTQTRLFIVWASLTAEREGLSPSSSFIRRNLDWLCSIENIDSEIQMVLEHVRWMVTQSYWKHRSCSADEQLSLYEQSLAKPQMQIIEDSLDSGWEHKRLATVPLESPEWMKWILLEKEQQLKERYVNLHLLLQGEVTTTKGLFHEWQIRPLMTTINESSVINLSIKGVGRVYTSMWTGTNNDFIETTSANLTVQREIQSPSGDTVDPLDCSQGQRINLHTHVQTTPHTPFCLRQWHASGLANHRVAESHFCTISNADGQWHDIQQTYIVFEGRFRLPATIVATKTEMAHTNTIWFETRQYKELIPD